jgi:thiamine pyrophosphate-dependent acetolactate synthase large subunit-like protein
LLVVVLDNGEYGTTGGQRTATAGVADLEGAARMLGIVNACTVKDVAALETALQESRRLPGPYLIVAKVKESTPVAKPPLDCVFIKQRFMAALGNPEPATNGTSLPTF